MNLGNAPLALAFTAGLVATVNPCGFAMLPAYLSYFLGLEGDGPRPSRERNLGRALAVTAMLTTGFVVVFATVGLLLRPLQSQITAQMPWATIAIGGGLVLLGIFTLSGRTVRLPLPHLQKGTGSRELSSMFLFGVSYALSSLTCTIGPFVAATASTFKDDGTIAGLATFVTYGLGMGAMVSLLTMAVALTRTGLVARFRRSMRYVNLASGVLLLGSGAYLVNYGRYELRLRSNTAQNPVRDPVVDTVSDVVSGLSQRLEAGRTLIGVLAALAVGSSAMYLVARRLRMRKAASTPTASTKLG
ncbi:MAG: cytochrome c biogenesis CcdA family protein [Acidimicrobiales bacterium]